MIPDCVTMQPAQSPYFREGAGGTRLDLKEKEYSKPPFPLESNMDCCDFGERVLDTQT